MAATNNSKGFFAVDLCAFKELIEVGVVTDDLFAYVVLACHTSGEGEKPHRISTAGARAVETKTGMSGTRAKKAIDRLICDGFLIQLEGAKSARSPRYELVFDDEETDLVYLSHALVHGVGRGVKSPPLMRIYNRVGIAEGISAKQARRDALCMLISLFKHQSMRDYAGINPTVLHRRWIETEQTNQVGGVNLVRVRPDDNRYASKVDCMGMPDDRFWHSILQLEQLGFLYKNLVVWDDDPFQEEDAEPLYTLYVFDRKSEEPQLAHFINRQVVESLIEEEGFESGKYENAFEENKRSGMFWMVEGGFPLEIYRLKFRPATLDVGLGVENEQRRNDQFQALLTQSF